MSKDELRQEIRDGVVFWGYLEGEELLGVMGIQDVKDVSLIRHAYVRTTKRNQGIGGRLLVHLQSQTTRPLLVGTWADATWAIRFYEKRGFRQVNKETKDRLLNEYWSIPKRQVETSVVVADEKWFETQNPPAQILEIHLTWSVSGGATTYVNFLDWAICGPQDVVTYKMIT